MGYIILMELKIPLLWYYRLITALILFCTDKTEGWQDVPPDPYFLSVPENVTVERGSPAVLKCAVANLGTRHVTWRKTPYITPIISGDKRFVTDTRFASQHNPQSNQWNLYIRNTRLQDSGTYECQLSLKHRQQLRQKVTLNVIEETISTRPGIKIGGTRFVTKGESIYIECNATGSDYPPDHIDWFLNGNKLYTDPRRRVLITSRVSLHTKTLTSAVNISNATLRDTGTYVCRTSSQLTRGMRVDVLNAGTYNVKRGANNQTTKTESKPLKDKAIFLHSSADVIWLTVFTCYIMQ
ncbi:lachesin-like [Saccostrea echinata]|uniref:lachesin-like n=1 Tax=Saccostrea echinata TaxID=191078 RepID=UPI002A827B2F|nr:lachesin-like [Saccostrea echinata]